MKKLSNNAKRSRAKNGGRYTTAELMLLKRGWYW